MYNIVCGLIKRSRKLIFSCFSLPPSLSTKKVLQHQADIFRDVLLLFYATCPRDVTKSEQVVPTMSLLQMCNSADLGTVHSIKAIVQTPPFFCLFGSLVPTNGILGHYKATFFLKSFKTRLGTFGVTTMLCFNSCISRFIL